MTYFAMGFCVGMLSLIAFLTYIMERDFKRKMEARDSSILKEWLE